MNSHAIRWVFGSWLAAVSLVAQADSSPPASDAATVIDLAQAPPGPPALTGHETPSRSSGSSLLTLAAAPLGDEVLSQVRGGFVTDTGLKISFGIERAVYINGDLVTTTRLSTPDLSATTGGRSSDPAGTLALVQNGAGNYFLSEIGRSALPSVIQNTLDNQAIRTVTVINASVNSMDLLRSMNLSSSVRNAIADFLPR